MAEPTLNVLVPAAGIAGSLELIDMAGAFRAYYGGHTTVLSVVEVPEDRSLSEGALLARRRRSLLQRLARIHPDGGLKGAVRSAHSVAVGIREAVREQECNLLLLSWNPRKRSKVSGGLEQLIDDPPCDLAMVKPGKQTAIRSVLLPVRGGPHAALALRLAQAIASQHDAVLTLLHVRIPVWSEYRLMQEELYFNAVVERIRYGKTSKVQVDSTSVEAALLEHGAEHDIVIMGAAARDEKSMYTLGRIPSTVAQRLDSSVVVVKTREPVTRSTFGLVSERLEVPGVSISEVVDQWFANNTFHSHEFRQIRYLLDLKERQGRVISLALPTLNEENTVGKIVATIRRRLMDEIPLIDEFVVIDSQSDDKTVEIVEDLGIPVYQHSEILPEHGSYRGKGEALWKSLHVTHGDIVVWVDSDITNFHPKFVYGLIGPLLTQPELGFVKGFYRRPLNLGGQRHTTGGGRVTELTARPLINLFFPELSGLVQPLAGEMAGRRDVLESVPFFTGYGVETGLLIDILKRFGLKSIAQTDLEERVHRNQSLLSLSKMAFAIIQVVMGRMGAEHRLQMAEDMNTSMKLIHYGPNELSLEVQEVREYERPPIQSLAEYRRSGGGGQADVAMSGRATGAGEI